MQEILVNKLYEYIRQNNPDVLFSLQEEAAVTKYLQQKIESVANLIRNLQSENKPAYIIEELCLDAMTTDLRPSKFNYISAVLEEEFETDYYKLKENGTLTYEVINMITVCNPVFESFGFTEENEGDRQLKYAVTGTIHEYLTKKVESKEL